MYPTWEHKVCIVSFWNSMSDFISEFWLVNKYLKELLDKTVDDDDDYRGGTGKEGRRGGGQGGGTSKRKARKRKGANKNY